jgi:ATP adenylyltransferase
MKHLWSPWRMAYIRNGSQYTGCVFCDRLKDEDSSANLIIHRGSHAFVILNRYPYTTGHMMIVPYQHVSTFEALDENTLSEIMQLTIQALRTLRKAYMPQGFNIGANIGEIAGAGVADHVHMHVLPRWTGDTNFMSTTAETRVLPEALEETYARLREEWMRSEEL